MLFSDLFTFQGIKNHEESGGSAKSEKSIAQPTCLLIIASDMDLFAMT